MFATPELIVRLSEGMANLALFPRLLQLPILLRMELLLTPAKQVPFLVFGLQE